MSLEKCVDKNNMEACSRELALAIRLTKILSVSSNQGKEEYRAHPTRDFIEEMREALSSSISSQLLTRSLYFLARVIQKDYTQLLVGQQEYALWLALAILEKRPNKALQSKSGQLAVRVLENLSLYLRQNELITQEEQASWRRAENLLETLFRYLIRGENYRLTECPSHVSELFPAYFIQDNVPEDFQQAALDQSLLEDKPALLEDTITLGAFERYLIEFLRLKIDLSKLCYLLMELLEGKQSLQFLTLLDAYRDWSRTIENREHVAKVTIKLGKISTTKNTQDKILEEAYKLLLENDEFYERNKRDLLSEEITMHLCDMVIIIISASSDKPSSPSKPSLDIKGFNKEEYVEDEEVADEFCTYHRTGKDYELQHWYYCYTCGLMGSKGACSVCARRCHKGHQVVYSRKGNFFCDCGDRYDSVPCISMPKGKSHLKRNASLRRERELSPDLFQLREIEGRDRSDIMLIDLDRDYQPFNFQLNGLNGEEIFELDEVHDESMEDIQGESEEDKKEEDEDMYLELEEKEESEKESEDDRFSGFESSEEESYEEEKATKPLIYRRESIGENIDVTISLVNLIKRTISRLKLPERKAQSSYFDISNLDYYKQLTRHICTLRSHTANLRPQSLELTELKDALAQNPGMRNTLAVSIAMDLIFLAEGNKLLCMDSSIFRCTGSTVDRSVINILSKHVMHFNLVSVVVNSEFPRLVAAVGMKECQCLLLHDKKNRGQIEKKITISLYDKAAYITKALWIPGRQTEIALCTNKHIEIFNLSKSVDAPTQVLYSIENDIKDVTVCKNVILAGSSKGYIYRQELTSDINSIILSESLEMNTENSGIVSIDWCEELGCVVVSFEDNKIGIGKLDSSIKEFSQFQILNIRDDKATNFLFKNTSGFAQVKAMVTEEGAILTGISRKTQSIPIVIKLSQGKGQISSLRKSLVQLEGSALYSLDGKIYTITNYDDGSLATHVIDSESEGTGCTLQNDQLNAWLTTDMLPSKVTLPVTFFEKCTPLNSMRIFGIGSLSRNDVILSGDPVLAFGSSKVALEKLSFEGRNDSTGMVSTVLPDPHCIAINVALDGYAAQSMVIAGFKINVEVGPRSYIEFLNRKLKLQSQRRWYDLPLTEIEMMKGYLTNQITIKIVTSKLSKTPIKLINFEIYGINKTNINLEQKLIELSRAAQGVSHPSNLTKFYRQQYDWNARANVLQNLPHEQRLAVTFATALGSVIKSPLSSLNELISNIAVTSVKTDNKLFACALKQCLKGMLNSLKLRSQYPGLKGLILAWALMENRTPHEDIVRAAIKCWSNLAKDHCVMYFYILNNYPEVIEVLMKAIQPKMLATFMEEILRILLTWVKFAINKQIFYLESPIDKLRACLSISEQILHSHYQYISSLMESKSPEVREAIVSKLYSLIKKKSSQWIKHLRSVELHSSFLYHLREDLLYGDLSSSDLTSQITTLLDPSDTGHIDLLTPDLGYYTIYFLSRNLTGELPKVDSKLCMIYKCMNLAEKMWAMINCYDPRYIKQFLDTIQENLTCIDCEATSEGKVYFLNLTNILLSHSIQQYEKSYSKKELNSSAIQLIRYSCDSSLLEMICNKLVDVKYQVYSRMGTITASYNMQTRDDVNRYHELIKFDDKVLLDCWQNIFGADEKKIELDELLLKNLIEMLNSFLTILFVFEDEEQILPSIENLLDGEAGMELDRPKLELPGYKFLREICDILINPAVSSLKPSTEKLIDTIITINEDCLEIKNDYIFSRKLHDIKALAESTQYLEASCSFENLININSILNELTTYLKENRQYWRKYILKEIQKENSTSTIQLLIRLAFNLTGKAATDCVTCLAYIFGIERKGNEYVVEEVDRTPSVWQTIYTQIEDQLPLIIELLLLERNNESIRSMTSSFICGLWKVGTYPAQVSLLELIVDKFKHVHNYGKNSDYFMSTLNFMMNNISLPELLRDKLFQYIMKRLKKTIRYLSSHVNAEIYELISKLLNITGEDTSFHKFILEREPCIRCFDSKNIPFSQQKLAEIQAESKFTDSCHLIKLKEAYSFSSITIQVSESRGHKALRQVSVYFSNVEGIELSELKNNPSLWNLMKTVIIQPQDNPNIKIDIPVPVTMLNLILEFHTINVIRATQEEPTSLYSNKYFSPRKYPFLSTQRVEQRGEIIGTSLGGEREILPCPRCNKPVEDKHGICSCGENAFQCVLCRNINYEHLDAFLCNECGVSRYCKLDIHFLCKPGVPNYRITNEKERTQANSIIDKHLENIQTHFDNLPKYKDTLYTSVQKYRGQSSIVEENSEHHRGVGKNINPVIMNIVSLYTKEYNNAYQDMMKNVKIVVELRKALSTYQSKGRNLSWKGHDIETSCYGCNYWYVCNLLQFLQDIGNTGMAATFITQYDMVKELVERVLRNQNHIIRQEGRKALHTLVRDNLQACIRLYSLSSEHLHSLLQWSPFPIELIKEETQLILDLCSYNIQSCIGRKSQETEDVWETTIRFFWKVFFMLLEKSWNDVSLAELLASFMDLIYDMIVKTLILVEDPSIPQESDPRLQEIILSNPTIYKRKEHASNMHERFIHTILHSEISSLYPDWIQGKVTFETWRSSGVRGSGKLHLPGNWVVDLLLYSNSTKVQDVARLILLNLCWSGMWDKVLDVVLEELPQALKVCRQGFDYYFTVLSHLLCEEQVIQEAWVIEKLLKAVEVSVNYVLQVQNRYEVLGTYNVNISLGHGLVCLLHMIYILSESEWVRQAIRNNSKLAYSILSSYLTARKLNFVRNKVITESQDFLAKLTDLLHIDCNETIKHNFLTQCVSILMHTPDDMLAQTYLIKLMTRVIAPSKPEPVYYLQLDKVPTQEEFIRGSMEKNPYSNQEVGPLMNNVRLRICKELDLSDPDLLELLVADQIIDPSLPIVDVYEKVLWPNLQQHNEKFANKEISDFAADELPLMVVIYRLAGLDGEATEDRVDTIATNQAEELSPEVKYSVANVLSNSIQGKKGVEMLLRLIAQNSDNEFLNNVLELLFYASKLSSNRVSLCEEGGVVVLTEKLQENLSEQVLIQLLQLLGCISSDPYTQNYVSGSLETITASLELLEKYLNSKEVVARLTQLLPYFCHESEKSCRTLVEYFSRSLNFSELKSNIAYSDPKMDIWMMILDALPVSHTLLRDVMVEMNITPRLIAEFSQINPDVTAHENISSCLRALAGLLRGHAASQRLLTYELIELVFSIRKISSKIGIMSEMLIEAIIHEPNSDNETKQKLKELTSGEEIERKKKAAEKKDQILKEFVTRDLSAFDEMLAEEPGLSCVICQEGYTLRPQDLLGFYIYSKPVIVSTFIENLSNVAEHFTVMSLVTHFNCIHLGCHEEAARAEQNLKRPKSEWEGAVIRNQHTKCNNWFPIRGPEISKDLYSIAVDKLFSGYELVDNRLHNNVHDLRILLSKFAFEESFSKESRGGGAEHNLQAVPYMLQMLFYLMEEDLDQALFFKEKHTEFGANLSALNQEQMLMHITLKLLHETPSEWRQALPELVLACMKLAPVSRRSDSKTLKGLHNQGDCEARIIENLAGLKPFLIQIKIVDMVLGVLLYECEEANWRVIAQDYLMSASPLIQERVIKIFEELRSFQSLPVLHLCLDSLQLARIIPAEAFSS
jgi:hypothetical protein